MKEKEKTKEEKTSLRPSPTALLNPRMDVNFKAIFTQETEESNEALKSFLSSVLGKEVVKVQISANEPPVDIPSQIQMTFDVSVTFNNGEKADIEMQGQDQKYDFSIRSEIQVARLLNNNAKKEAIGLQKRCIKFQCLIFILLTVTNLRLHGIL